MENKINASVISDSGTLGQALVFLHGFCVKSVFQDLTALPLLPIFSLVKQKRL